MNTPLRTAAVALALAVVPFAASPANAASRQKAKHTTTAATTAAAPVTSVISIGGYVFYNLTYAEAVDAYFAAVAAAPAGHVQPAVTSVSVSTTVSGTVEG